MNHIFDQIQNVKETLSITSANLVMKYAEKENKYVIGGVDLAVAVQKAWLGQPKMIQNVSKEKTVIVGTVRQKMRVDKLFIT